MKRCAIRPDWFTQTDPSPMGAGKLTGPELSTNTVSLSAESVDRSVALPIDDMSRRYAAAAFANNTARAYASAWSEYAAWCVAHGIDPMPPHPNNLCRYLAKLADDGAAISTISHRLSAIKHVFHAHDHRAPLDHPEVKLVWAGIRNRNSKPAKGAKALLLSTLRAMLENAPPHNEDNIISTINLRNRAVLLVGFWGALRRSELCAIDVEHLEDHPLGLVLTVPKSKMNQTGLEAEYKLLPRKTEGYCPVDAITQWRTHANIHSGPLLRGLGKTHKPRSTRMNHQSVADILHQMLKAAGEPTEGYSPHSLRAGFITTARLAGIDKSAIAHLTDQSEMTIDRYTRIADLGIHNAAVMLEG
jgi:site-specific recombinase XerD